MLSQKRQKKRKEKKFCTGIPTKITIDEMKNATENISRGIDQPEEQESVRPKAGYLFCFVLFYVIC